MPETTMPPFQNFGERPGQRTSASFLDRLNQEVYANRTGATWPLIVQNTPSGPVIGIDRSSLEIYRVKLTEDLYSGYKATGNIAYYSLAEFEVYNGRQVQKPIYSDEITVYDRNTKNGKRIAREGEWVLAKAHTDSGILETINEQDEDFILGILNTRTLTSGVYIYTFRQKFFDSTTGLPSSDPNCTPPDGGGAGDGTTVSPILGNAVEVNNYRISVTADQGLNSTQFVHVWLRRVLQGPVPQVVVTKTRAGNGAGTTAAFSLYLKDATGGEWWLTVDGYATISFTPTTSATDIHDEMENAIAFSGTGDTISFSSLSGSGTEVDPWTFSVTSDADDHEIRSDGQLLSGDDLWAFACPMPMASTDQPGAVSTVAQSFVGAKTFTSTVSVANSSASTLTTLTGGVVSVANATDTSELQPTNLRFGAGTAVSGFDQANGVYLIGSGSHGSPDYKAGFYLDGSVLYWRIQGGTGNTRYAINNLLGISNSADLICGDSKFVVHGGIIVEHTTGSGYVSVPAPPASGDYRLVSSGGVLSWVTDP
jgi:hypothetical protein